MDYVKKLEKMDEHLKEHPHDYQTVISRLKTASDAFEQQRRWQKEWRLKRVAEVRRQLKEIEDAKKSEQ